MWLWNGGHGEHQLGDLGAAPDYPARSPYRLMERFLMDGLYPSRTDVLLSCAFPALPPARPQPTPVPQGPEMGDGWESAQASSCGVSPTHTVPRVLDAACSAPTRPRLCSTSGECWSGRRAGQTPGTVCRPLNLSDHKARAPGHLGILWWE